MAAFGTDSEQSKPRYLKVTKSVTKSDLAPGDEFTYTIHAICSQGDCVNGSIFDQLPEELHGFELTGVTITPVNGPVKVTWTVDGDAQEAALAKVTADTSIRVDALQELDLAGDLGIVNGAVLGLNLTLKVPANYPPGTSGTITNTAVATADNAEDSSNSGDIVISSPVLVDASNVNVAELVLEEPAFPLTDNKLSGANPFNVVDFAGFGDVNLPEGATGVRVDALVETDGVWDWVVGTPNSEGELLLPSGAQPEGVAGTRITLTGDFAPGAQIAYDFDVAQRLTERSDDDLSPVTTNIANEVAGTITSGEATNTICRV